MPGIHVRSLGKLDWDDRGNEPVLTIPGAYWLCHKKHIYKFTFKWHKTLRNTEGFAYAKELTKVIRRIIKSQPRQGQQFGTRHLLVTYNHSTWMRQDKMFAMMKFQKRTDATAYPQAFILTVQTLNDDENPETQSIQQVESRTSNLEKAPEKKVEGRGKTREEPPRDNVKTMTSSNEKSSGSRHRENERKRDREKVTPRGSLDDDEAQAFLPIKRRCSRRGESEKAVPSLGTDERMDSADLPYQYIIEKEILNGSREKTKDAGGSTSSKDNLAPGKLLNRGSPAIETTRSADDITDLVMEGLMFTIRQDQDTVTVVEQKTKLEVDEVLENSEKAETKEGAKCLVNSSLLSLENLITKIEKSAAKLKDDKTSQSGFKNSPLGSLPALKSPEGSDRSVAMVKINLDNVRDLLNDRLHYDAPFCEEGPEKDVWDDEDEDEVGLELKFDDRDETVLETPQTAITPMKNSNSQLNEDFSLSGNLPRIISNEIISNEIITIKTKSNSAHPREIAYSPEVTTPSALSEAPFTLAETEISQDTIEAPKTIDISRYPEGNEEKSEKPRRKSLRHSESSSDRTSAPEPELRLDMWKFMRDMTYGAKVVVRRLNLADIRSTSIAKYNSQLNET